MSVKYGKRDANHSEIRDEQSERFVDAAQSGNIESSVRLGGWIIVSYIISYEDGVSGVWRGMTDDSGFHDGNSEVAAYRINRLMGGNEVPPTVFSADGNGNPGTSQMFVDGAKGPCDGITVAEAQKIPRIEIERVLALDMIIDNGDRHAGNWLYKDGHLIAIDHGGALWTETATWNEPFRNTVATLAKERKRADFHNTIDVGACGPPEELFKFSPEFLGELARITSGKLLEALDGLSQSGRVNTGNAWKNLRHIVEKGSYG